MTPDRWQQIEKLYHAALERKAAARPTFLREACGDDEELRREVESLLDQDKTEENFLERPALEMAAKIFGGTTGKPLLGRKLGTYEILVRLGKGGMGEVYRARDHKLGREIALKVLPPEFVLEPKRLTRFRREAQLLASLNHPNIATIHAIDEIDGVNFLVMELVEGETLAQRMAAGPLTVQDAVVIAAQIGAGLAVAHQSRVVHRDLKPQNVMIRTDDLVKILDFGLGKLDPSAPNSASMQAAIGPHGPSTSSGIIMGTVDYMSPQQARGANVDFRSDQFSFGTLLYELVAGERPFHRDSVAQTLTAIIEHNPPPPSSCNPDVPPALDAVIQRCLSKNPEERYSSTDELARALKGLRDRTAVELDMRWPADSPPLPAEKHLAVLPFTNIGGDSTSQPFCDGLVETLTTKLSQLEQFQRALSVVPASEVRQEGITSARQARKAFGVTMVVTGSVQRSDDRVRLTINLVDPRTLRQLKAKSIDTEARDISVLQDGIVLEVASLLDVDLPLDAKQLLSAGGTTVPGAYDFYLQGRGYMQRFEHIENLENAVVLFQRALESDAQYALAYSGLGEAYWRKYELTKDPESAELARKNCQTAMQFNAKLAPVHATLGAICTGTGQFEEGAERLQRAIEIDPLNPDAYRELGKAYEAMGMLPEAESTFLKAVAVRPSLWGSYNALGNFYLRLGRYSEAEKQYRRVLSLSPDNPRAFNNLAAVYNAQNRYEEAALMFEKSASLRQNDTVYSNLAAVYFALGRYADAARISEQALQINDRNYRTWRNLAASYYWAPNEREKARPAFARAAELAEEARKLNPRNPNLLVHLADCYSQTGQEERAREILSEALGISQIQVRTLFNAAVVYERLGDRARALEWIGEALRLGYSRDLVERSPSLVELRADPIFQRLSVPKR